MYHGLLLIPAVLGTPRTFAPLQTAREAKPGVSIKAESAEQPFSFVAGMTQAKDGSLFLLDPPGKTVFRYSQRGDYLGRIGRNGAGPGEFTWPMVLAIVDDELWVVDYQLRRVTTFDREFRAARTTTVDLRGLTVPMAGGTMAIQPFPDEKPPGVDRSREAISLLLIFPDGKQVTAGRWIVDESRISVPVGGRALVTQQPFADRPLWSVAPDGKAVAVIEAQPGAGSSLVGISATGEIRFRTALPLPRLTVTDALYITTIDSLVEAWGAARPGGAKAIPVDRAAVVKAVKRPRDLNPVAQVLAGSDGRIWLRLRSQAPAGLAEWRSYTATGTPSSAILLPSNMRFMLFTGTAAWGAGEDSDGEPTVVEYVLP